MGRKSLATVPDIEQLLEVAHVLPGPVGFPKPIIIRFYNCNLRDICFRLKKFYAPKEEARSPGGRGGGTSGGSGGGVGDGEWGSPGREAAGVFEGRGKYCFPLYEDFKILYSAPGRGGEGAVWGSMFGMV